MRRLGFLALAALVSCRVYAQSQPVSNASCVTGQNFTPKAFAYEEITVGATAKFLTIATYRPAGQNGAMMAFISVETDNIRFRIDGGTPTSTVGHPVLATSTSVGSFIICEAALPRLQMIRSGSVDAAIKVTYFNQP